MQPVYQVFRTVHVHTQANPGGEIRGQVTPPKG